MSNGGSGGGHMFGPAEAEPTIQGGAAYTPVKQGPVYQPQYQQYQPQPRAMQSQQMPNYQSGLQAAMMQMMQQYSRPMMRAPMQQGLQPSSALAYRPNMANITSNLNRVAPSVELQQRLAAEQEAKEKAEKAAYDAANPQPAYSDYGGAGG